MSFSHPFLLAIGLSMSIVAAIGARSLGGFGWFFIGGLLLLALAAGSPWIALHPARGITVMVDLSPSTRGAAFRDRAALLRRIGELVGNLPVQIVAFSDHTEPLPVADVLPDLACEQTRFDPPAADAILLFSDGRFTLPVNGAPTYPVIDPMLIEPPDAAVTEMHFDGTVPIATVANRGAARELSWVGTGQNQPIAIDDGTSAVHGSGAVGSLIQAHLNAGDLWPENDSLTLPAEPPELLAKWWIGVGPVPAGWTPVQAADLPADPAAYVNAGMIALSNVAADELSATQQQRLAQYVGELGGTLLVLGGDHAFAAGGYAGSELDSLSPLASNPPGPLMHWMLLADGSGSMGETFHGESRWSAAVKAIGRVLPLLPPKDTVSVGSFARDLSWWVDGESASAAAQSVAVPSGIGPNGPTNLESALAQIAAIHNRLPSQLLLLTDADVTMDHAQSLASALEAEKVTVSLLGLANVSTDNPVVQIVKATGGHWISSDDPSQWSDSLQRLMRSASASHLEESDIELRFAPAFGLARRLLHSWNRAWAKSGATPIATATLGGDPIPLAIQWHVGVGNVAALAFAPTPDEVQALTQQLGEPPRDPRFKVSWQCASTINVSVDAGDAPGYMKGLQLNLAIVGQPPLPLPQIEPGRYALEIPALRSPALATLQLDGHVIDRRALPGRYAPEFDAIGNDDAALAALAASSGGRVIGPAQHVPIGFRWPARLIRIDSYLAAAGAALIAAGAILMRRSRAI